MDITKQLDRVRSLVGPEKVEEINDTLKEIEVGVVGLIDNVKDASAESKARKLKIRQMQSDLNDKETDIAELTEKADVSKYEDEIKSLRAFKDGVIEEGRNSFINRYEKFADNPRMEKASQFFTLPDKDEDGKMDWSKIEDDAMAKNLAEFKKLETLDYFDGVQEVKKDVAGDNVPTGQVDYNTRIQKATTMEELNAINDEMAGA